MAKSKINKLKTGNDSVKTPVTNKKKCISSKDDVTVHITRHSSGSEAEKKLKVSPNNDSTSSRNISSKSNSSSPYDFMEDSPKPDAPKKSEKVKSGAGTINKTSKSVRKSSKALPKEKSNTSSSKSSKTMSLSKGNENACKKKGSTVTPKSRTMKPVLKEDIKEQTDVEQHKRKRILKAIPPLNLDDISPIIRGRRSNSSAKRKKEEKQDKVKGLNTSRKSPRVQAKLVSSSTSFTEPVEEADSNDSALFLSPRKTMPRFSNEKTSTPADLPVKIKSRTAAVKKVSKNSLKKTSTPNEIKTKPKRDFTNIKQNISRLSPVQRTETPSPTSDYASMDSFMTPSPAPPAKQSRKRRGSSPAFKLEEDDSEESLDLNKSINKSYKKMKRKYETSRQSTSKLDEWADRVNSELEDVENFELSVEG